MSPYIVHDCDFQQFLLIRNKAINAGRFCKNAGNKRKCGISRMIAGLLTPMCMSLTLTKSLRVEGPGPFKF